MKLFIFVLVVFALFFAPVIAQDSTIPLPTDCSAETVKAVLTAVNDAVDAALANIDSVESAESAAVLETTKQHISLLRSLCDELAFADSAAFVTDLVTFPAGLYRATATTTGYMTVYVTPIEGECGSGARMSQSSLFNLTKGNATNGADAVFKSEGCTAIVEVSNVQDDWTLTFENLG